MIIQLFKQLEIGQRFRLARAPRRDLIKIEPIRRPNSNSIMYNCQFVDTGRNTNIGHNAKCLLPPYEPTTKRPTTWQQLTPAVQAAGWRNVGELLAALLAGTVEIPHKPE